MTGCIVWPGRRNEHGYGVTTGLRYAHRVAWEDANGPIPAGKIVMHLCDNPPCVNPDHLRVGTRTENSADMVAKGRSQKGEEHTQVKLTAGEVRAIRFLSEAGQTQAAIAAKYGVSRAAVGLIVQRKRWAHVA